MSSASLGPNAATDAVLNPQGEETPDAGGAIQPGEPVILQPVPSQGEGAVQAVPAPEASPTEATKASEDLREAVGEQSQTAQEILDQMAEMSIDVGSTSISLLDGLIFLAVVIGIFFFAVFGSKLAHSTLARATRLDQTRRLLAEKIITIVVWGMAIFIGIDLLGIDLTALAVFSGAFGLAIGFGLQKTFGNLIAGIILLMDKSIKPGDVIAIADQAGVPPSARSARSASAPCRSLRATRRNT